MQTLELVTFRTLDAKPDDFLDANGPISDWLRRQPGFVSRHLAMKDDGTWIDIVFWETHESALAASNKMMDEMGQSEAMTMIDPMSIVMSHGSIRLSVD